MDVRTNPYQTNNRIKSLKIARWELQTKSMGTGDVEVKQTSGI